MTKIVKKADGTEERALEQPTAADLGTFGTSAWLKSVITDYSTTFAPLNNAGASVKEHFLKNSEMAGWSKANAQVWRLQANEQSLEDLAAFLQSQGGRKSPLQTDRAH